jgi:hypothetical protein
MVSQAPVSRSDNTVLAVLRVVVVEVQPTIARSDDRFFSNGLCGSEKWRTQFGGGGTTTSTFNDSGRDLSNKANADDNGAYPFITAAVV